MKKQLVLFAAVLLAAASLRAQNCDDPCQGTMTIHHPPGYTFPSGVYPSVADQSLTMTFKVVRTDLTGTDQCWMAQNLGSTALATWPTDNRDDAAGWYWQFNRKQAYKWDSGSSSRTPSTTWITSISESSDWTLANDPCRLLLGGNWRLPTRSEWENADSNSLWNDYNDSFSSVLKLHAAGWLSSASGSLYNRNSDGQYWSSSQPANIENGFCLEIDGSLAYINSYVKKASGYSVRCLSDM